MSRFLLLFLEINLLSYNFLRKPLKNKLFRRYRENKLIKKKEKKKTVINKSNSIKIK